MSEYLLRLAVLLPIVCAGAYFGLKLLKRLQDGAAGPGAERSLRIEETLALGPQARIGILACGGRRLLIAVDRGGVRLLADLERTA